MSFCLIGLGAWLDDMPRGATPHQLIPVCVVKLEGSGPFLRLEGGLWCPLCGYDFRGLPPYGYIIRGDIKIHH